MLLHEIISANEVEEKSILVEKLLPYKKSLLTYYSDLFCCDPILMVVSVSNSAQYAKIVSSNEFSEAIESYVKSIPDLSEEDQECEMETISFNSILLNTL